MKLESHQLILGLLFVIGMIGITGNGLNFTGANIVNMPDYDDNSDDAVYWDSQIPTPDDITAIQSMSSEDLDSHITTEVVKLINDFDLELNEKLPELQQTLIEDSRLWIIQKNPVLKGKDLPEIFHYVAGTVLEKYLLSQEQAVSLARIRFGQMMEGRNLNPSVQDAIFQDILDELPELNSENVEFETVRRALAKGRDYTPPDSNSGAGGESIKIGVLVDQLVPQTINRLITEEVKNRWSEFTDQLPPEFPQNQIPSVEQPIIDGATGRVYDGMTISDAVGERINEIATQINNDIAANRPADPGDDGTGDDGTGDDDTGDTGLGDQEQVPDVQEITFQIGNEIDAKIAERGWSNEFTPEQIAPIREILLNWAVNKIISGEDDNTVRLIIEPKVDEIVDNVDTQMQGDAFDGLPDEFLGPQIPQIKAAVLDRVFNKVFINEQDALTAVTDSVNEVAGEVNAVFDAKKQPVIDEAERQFGNIVFPQNFPETQKTEFKQAIVQGALNRHLSQNQDPATAVGERITEMITNMVTQMVTNKMSSIPANQLGKYTSQQIDTMKQTIISKAVSRALNQNMAVDNAVKDSIKEVIPQPASKVAPVAAPTASTPTAPTQTKTTTSRPVRR